MVYNATIMTSRIVVVSFICLCSVSVSAEWARPDLVAKVASGELREARAAWWGFDAADSTAYLQAAINSGAAKLIVEKMPSPWVVTPIRGASNQHVVFEKGAVLLAKRGEFVGQNDWLFYYLFAENAYLTGYGATFRMWREDYARGKDGKGRDYRRGEWRHTLAIRNSRNVVVEGLTLEESGGDGANVGIVVKPGCGPVGLDYGRGDPSTFCRDIVLRDLVCDRNHRQGLSVCSVENLLVENCIFKNTKGTWPMDGVDIEPDSPSNRVVNCVFRNCVAENNAGNGFEVALHQFRKTSYPVSVRFENCRTVGSRNAVALRTGAPVSDGGYPQGTMDFDGCSFEGCGYSALHVLQIPENSIKIGFRNCRVSDFGKADSAAPLAFLEAPRFDDPLPAIPEMSGLACPNLGTRARICFSTRNFATLGEKDVPRLAPEVVDARVVDAAPGEFAECTAPRMQGKLRFAVYADRARKVRIRARRAIPEGPRCPLPKGKIAVTDMSGAPVANVPLPDYESTELSFDAPKAGFYWLSAMVNVGALAVEATDSPIAADCTQFDYLTRPLRFHVSTGSVYVPVAAGQEAAFVVGGDMPGARIGMRVYEPGGKLVFEKGSILEWTRYVTPNAEKDGLWRIEFEKPSIGGMWAYYAEVTGVRPFFFLSPKKFWFSAN